MLRRARPLNPESDWQLPTVTRNTGGYRLRLILSLGLVTVAVFFLWNFLFSATAVSTPTIAHKSTVQITRDETGTIIFTPDEAAQQAALERLAKLRRDMTREQTGTKAALDEPKFKKEENSYTEKSLETEDDDADIMKAMALQKKKSLGFDDDEETSDDDDDVLTNTLKRKKEIVLNEMIAGQKAKDEQDKLAQLTQEAANKPASKESVETDMMAHQKKPQATTATTTPKANTLSQQTEEHKQPKKQKKQKKQKQQPEKQSAESKQSDIKETTATAEKEKAEKPDPKPADQQSSVDSVKPANTKSAADEEEVAAQQTAAQTTAPASTDTAADDAHDEVADGDYDYDDYDDYDEVEEDDSDDSQNEDDEVEEDDEPEDSEETDESDEDEIDEDEEE